MPRGVSVESIDVVAGKTLGGCERCPHGTFEARQSAGSAKPKRAVAVLKQTPDIVAGQLRRVLGVVDGEFNAVEANCSSFGSQPQIAVARLQNGMDGILGQPVLNVPGLAFVAAGTLAVIERKAGLEKAGNEWACNR
jgi:hypothetical protein